MTAEELLNKLADMRATLFVERQRSPDCVRIRLSSGEKSAEVFVSRAELESSVIDILSFETNVLLEKLKRA